MRPGRAADHSPPSSAAVMEEYSYASTHPLGHTGPVTGSLWIFYIQNEQRGWIINSDASGRTIGSGLLHGRDNGGFSVFLKSYCKTKYVQLVREHITELCPNQFG